MAKASELPNLSNATPTYLVDELGAVRAQMNSLKTLDKYYGEALKSKLGEGENEIKGERYVMKRTSFGQRKFNQEAALKILEEVAPDRLAEVWNDITVTQMRFSEVKDER